MRAYVPTSLHASVVYVPTCLLASVVYVPTCQKRANFSFLRANVPINVPTCHTACQCFNLACKHAKRRANVSTGVPIFQTFLLQDAKGNFYTLLLYKKFYIILDIIVINIICICIVHKNSIQIHFYTSCHIKEKCVLFFFFVEFEMKI